MRKRRVALLTAVLTTVIAAGAWIGRAAPDPSPSGPFRVAATEADVDAIVDTLLDNGAGKLSAAPAGGSR